MDSGGIIEPFGLRNGVVDIKAEKCTLNDLEAVAALYDKAVLHLTNTVNYPKWEYKVYPSRESVKKAISDGVQYMCVEDGAVLGAFILNDNPQGDYGSGDWKADLKDGEYLVIHTLAVDPDSQGCGIGKFMVKYCIDYAREHGFKAIRLDVVPENIPARRLYERLGFTFAGAKDLKRDIEDIPTFALYELNF